MEHLPRSGQGHSGMSKDARKLRPGLHRPVPDALACRAKRPGEDRREFPVRQCGRFGLRLPGDMERNGAVRRIGVNQEHRFVQFQ